MNKSYNQTNKNNNGWILCPSKTFPGKFYYFNVVNGEAAWSMNDTEKIVTKKDNAIHKIADKSHCYPEPDTPPIESPEVTTTNPYQQLKPSNLTNMGKSSYVQLPTFGQAAFPKYIPNTEPCMPSIIWMPIQCPTPVCVPETKRSMTDQVTQTSDPGILVQTCGPCCQRFVNYEKPTLNFDKQNKILNKDSYYFMTSMLLKNNSRIPNLKIRESDFETLIPNNKEIRIQTRVPNMKINEPVFQTWMPNRKEFQIQTGIPNLKVKEPVFETSTPNTKFQTQTGVPNLKIRKPVFNLESDSNVSRVDNGNSTLMDCNSLDNCKSDYVKFLPESDLRHRLMSARRRNVGDQLEGHRDIKNTVTEYETQKKVSFDLSNFLDEDTCSTTIKEDMPTTSGNQTTTQLSGNVAATNRTLWYIVVDTEVWLDEHEFIDTVVLSDKTCRLLIPHAVRADVEALSLGECRGRQRVFVARQLARRCATPPQHYVVEPAFSTAAGNVFTIDSILECCIDAINDNYRVIIISNDPQLHIKAKSNNIPCYKIQDIKSTDLQTQAEIDLKNIKITISRDCDNLSNCETVNISDDTQEVSVDSYRTHLFRENNAENKNIHVQNPILNYDSDSTTNEIKDLKNLNLKDKNHISNIKRTVLNSNYVPISKSNDQKENQIISKVVANSNIDELHFQQPNSKLNCENVVFQIQKSIPNSNNGSFLFQNAAKKYANTQLFDFKIPSTSTATFLKPNKTQIENTRIPKIPQNKQPTYPFPFENNLSSKFKFNNTNLKIPPSFHFQIQNEIKNNDMPVLDEQIKNIELDLKRFCVKNKIVDAKIQRRMEEWICSYIQIMENTLNDILQQSDHVVKKKLTPPWTLQEAILNIQIIYDGNAVMKNLVQKYLDFLANATCKNGKLNLNMKSNDFMKILGCGILLVQQFKSIQSDNQQLVDADKKLNLLLETIECPIELNMEEFDSLKTPVVCRSEIQDEKVFRCNFVKDTTYVLDYLRKHYKEWESYVEEAKPSVSTPPELKVVRTFGRNLKMLKICNNKSISLHKDVKSDSDGPKTIRSLNNKQPVERSAAKHMSADNDAVANIDDEPKTMKSTQKNQPIKRSLSLRKPVSILKTNKDIIEHNKAEPKTVKLIQNDQRITRSHTKNDKNTVKICESENAGPILVKTLANDRFKKESDDVVLLNSSQKAKSKSLDSPIHGNTFLQSNAETAGPKVIRNIKSLEKFKNTYKEPLDLDVLDYSGINESFSNDDVISMSCESYNPTDIIKNNHHLPKNDNFIHENHQNNDNLNDKNDISSAKHENINKNHCISTNDYLELSNDVLRNDSCTNDSGFENDSTSATTVVKIFFTELSDSFKIIYKFINDCIKEISNNISEERKKILHEKAADSLEHVGVVIQQMNSIITRELNDTTALRMLLLQAGIEASTDKRISRYRQFVTKCMEQAGILSNALKIIVSLTGDVDCESISESVNSSIRYFNIFDISS